MYIGLGRPQLRVDPHKIQPQAHLDTWDQAIFYSSLLCKGLKSQG